MNYIKMDEPVCPKQHARPVRYACGAKIFYPEFFADACKSHSLTRCVNRSIKQKQANVGNSVNFVSLFSSRCPQHHVNSTFSRERLWRSITHRRAS